MNYLLLAIPLAVLAQTMGWGPLWTFVFAAAGMIPLAGLLGSATEALAGHMGPRLGGLLNATMGNAAELIITIFAIKEGLLEVVKASITGSILGNILLVLGTSFIVGGVKHGKQHFERTEAGHKATLLLLALIALGIPSLFGHAIDEIHHANVESLSLSTAVVMMAIYILWLVYTMSNGDSTRHPPAEEEWSVKTAIAVLIVATVGLAYLSEMLVGTLEPVLEIIGWTEFFVGVIIIPILGNVAEHFVAIQVARDDLMDLSLEIALGSSLQIALFVAPLLVFISLLMGHPLTLSFDSFELSALGAGAFIAGMVAQDGESTWLEGAQLVAVYLILALAFFFL